MSWRKIRPLILAFLAAFLVICVTGLGVANTENEIQIFKMGTDVTVPAREVLTEVVAVGGNVTILDEAQVTNDAVAIGGDVVLKPNASVGGDAVAIGGQIIKEEGAIVDGSEVVMFSNAKVLFDRFGLFGTLYLTNALFSLISLMVVFAFGVFLLLLLPGHIQTITATMHQHPFKSGMYGLGGIVAITLFIALFAGSVFGFLLIPIANLAFLVAGLLGAIATGLWIGKKILSRSDKALIPFLVGMLVLAIISLIPIAGGLMILMLNLFGFGAVLLSRVGTVQPETIQKRFDQLEGTAQPSGT
ncbi:conserved membrane hypothetical protein [Hyella patelloides LEGE 07179]|uniref:DUF8173 domain-containing protein n=1 Tax=Hyella patelloides LEGE 07179 TaxID=945734 RepID=A0A563VMZ1_9CYAN|nr:hypothetical protein [Hyella patelloides]VEP12703.1 conserved membrane hypothetical protein [Hyella patelloides LEGE 07179]